MGGPPPVIPHLPVAGACPHTHPTSSSSCVQSVIFQTGPDPLGYFLESITLNTYCGIPTDVTVEMWTVADDIPGAKIEGMRHTQQVPGDLTGFVLRTFELGTPWRLDPGMPYALVLSSNQSDFGDLVSAANLPSGSPPPYTLAPGWSFQGSADSVDAGEDALRIPAG